ncbi:phage antirepressor N-terminal domain-containing protein [Pseudodesulfovibrio profundus]|uniref:phage antirepressor N-terminal domain-containing protein n=1 Tax=Pseudodesulfovibrio profundus TaxID=57320 RepID=UPI0012FF98C5|nr:phage antirepressor N-terminal domain-containing protein [Pseudodesulfovibrio profundus]
MSQTIIPVKHDEVSFCGTEILAAISDDGQCYFSPRHVCQDIGLDWASQFTKIKNDPFLASLIRNITTQLPGTSQRRTYTMLPIAALAGWLFTIKRARPEVQDKVNLYRLEAFHVLHNWFQKGLKDDPAVIRNIKQKNNISPAATRQWAGKQEKEQHDASSLATRLELAAAELRRKENAQRQL